jgi:hypothetical protein
MTGEPAKILLGDTAISAIGGTPVFDTAFAVPVSENGDISHHHECEIVRHVARLVILYYLRADEIAVFVNQ